MRTDPSDRRPEDLTARARIRDAAVDLFASAGYAGTSIRDVARAADVSPGLVQHHFRSKEGLRAECDAHVLEVLRANTARKLGATEFDGEFVASLYEANRPVLRYIARGLTEGWPGMAKIFDQAVEDSAAWLSATWPERFGSDAAEARLYAAVLAALSLSTAVLHRHVARASGVDPLEQQHVISGTMVELFMRMGQYMETETGRSMRTALADYERKVSSSGKKETDG